jgi:hypothetical protein
MKSSTSSMRVPDLITEGRIEGDRGRERWSPAIRSEIANFFKSRTEIMSGANTHTRKLLMSKGRLEIEFEAEYPAILRKTLRIEPSLHPNHKRPESRSSSVTEKALTRFQKDLIAADFAADQENFSAANEYTTRLDVALQR